MTNNTNDQELAREAKAIVALAFRNGPIELIHDAEHGVSRISNDEMKLIMKSAVNRVYKLLKMKANDPDAYARQITFGERNTLSWDDPE